MSSIKQVRVALANQIEEYTGLNSSYNMPNIVNPPQAVILPGNSRYVKYGVTLGEGAMHLPTQIPVPVQLDLVIAVFTSTAPGLDDAQDTVDKYLGLESVDGQMSIPMAIFQDPTLGGIVEYCEPIDVIAYGNISVNDQIFFQGRIAVQVSVTQDLGA